MRVVVTGATSMIGVALIKECIKNSDQVLAIVRKGTKRLNRLPKSDLLSVEYAGLNDLDSVCGDGRTYDVFYHFAWDHTIKEERDNPLLQEENIRTMLSAVQLANRLGCSKFVSAGSQAEYGIKQEKIGPDTKAEPIIAYGMAKLAANYLCKRLCNQLGITYIWTRIFSVYGCNDNSNTMIDYAIKQFQRGQVAEFSSATQKWNYLFEDDAGMMFYLLGKMSVEEGVYCIASNETKPLKEYIEEMRDSYPGRAECVFDKNAPGKVVTLDVDITKTTKAINYVPKVSFNEGIKRVIEFTEREQ